MVKYVKCSSGKYEDCTYYQIALSSFDGVSPQKYEIYLDRDEAQRWADKMNAQDNNPYAQWIVLEKRGKVRK